MSSDILSALINLCISVKYMYVSFISLQSNDEQKSLFYTFIFQHNLSLLFNTLNSLVNIDHII